MAQPHQLLLDRSIGPLRERVWLIPGYRSPANGVSGERIYYAVGTPERAYSFTVYTHKYPPEVTWLPAKPPEGYDVSLHERVDEGHTSGCICLDGARCRADGSGLMAAEQYTEWQGQHGETVPHDVVLAHLRFMHEEGTWTHSSP